VGLPGPIVDGPAGFILASDGLLRRGSHLLDAGGQAVGTLARGRGELSAGVTIGLERHGLLRLRIVATDMRGQPLVEIRAGQALAGGETYGWRRAGRGHPAPWVLESGALEVAVFTGHSTRARGVEVELTGAEPVALLLVLVCCHYVVTRTKQRAAAG
jgi:hypothetical protein